MTSRVINVHTHYQPESVLEMVRPYGIEMDSRDGGWYFRSGKVEYFIPGSSSGFWGDGVASRLPHMDENGIDVNVLQASPMIFSYHLEPKANRDFSRAFNDETASHVSEHPDRFWGAAQLPMQDVDMASEELERSVRDLGMRACSIGYYFGNGLTLADPEYDAFLDTAERLDVPILLHPVALGQDIDLVAGGAEWIRKNQVDWAWGYLFTETVAVVSMILGGALDRHPNLRVLIPHGGGMIPYQIGRLRMHAAKFASENGGLSRSIEDYLKQFYFDTVVHEPRSLKMLVDVMGADNVVLGSNYPGWDNAPIWDTIRNMPDLTDEQKRKVLGATADERLFRTAAQ